MLYYRDTVSYSLWAAHNINTLCAFNGDINENNFFSNVRQLVFFRSRSRALLNAIGMTTFSFICVTSSINVSHKIIFMMT